MNKNKILAIVTVIALSISSLTACVATNPSASNKKVTSVSKVAGKHTIRTINSGSVFFSKVKSERERSGYEVSGTVKLKTAQRQVLRLPGYITVTLKSANGRVVESKKAKYHRKFGASTVGHFEAKLDHVPENGSQIIVEHINK
jgi:hypothetical protein